MALYAKQKTIFCTKKITFLLLYSIFLTGCNTFNAYLRPANNSYGGSYYDGGFIYNNYEVEIISEPSAAKIEWNNNLIGTTPLRQVLNGNQGIMPIIIKAYPISSGQYLQQKVLVGYEPIPRRIYFDMSLQPAPSEYDINIQ